MLVREVIGALVFEAIAGYGACCLLSDIDSYPVGILITLALATASLGACTFRRPLLWWSCA